MLFDMKSYRQTLYPLWKQRKLLRGQDEESPQIELREITTHKLEPEYLKWLGIWLGIVLAVCIWTQISHAYTNVDEIKAIIGESEGESQQGKNAIACAIHNRRSLKGVYGLHAPRVLKRLYSRNTWDNAVIAIYMAQDQEYCQGLIHGAEYWESIRFKTPYWAKSMTVTTVIGNQIFYRKN